MTVTLFGQPFATVWDVQSAKPLSTMRLAVARRRGNQPVPPRLQGGGIVALSADGRRALVNGSVWDIDS
ncbi:MAG: hypothetical protein GTO03_00230, partial [Planctomycetales bacterium]|nr:hypothetical protein [Planctomycetales bacterium]